MNELQAFQRQWAFSTYAEDGILPESYEAITVEFIRSIADYKNLPIRPSGDENPFVLSDPLSDLVILKFQDGELEDPTFCREFRKKFVSKWSGLNINKVPDDVIKISEVKDTDGYQLIDYLKWKKQNNYGVVEIFNSGN